MRILRIRTGFQADHSSSSYLFYAVDAPVSDAGQRVAHRFSSRADVDEQFARYQKWGESELSFEAYRALLGEHYDVMASESYESWTLMIAVPKTAQMVELLRPFQNLDDGEFTRLGVHDFGKRLGIEVFCEFSYDGSLWSERGDEFEELVELLAVIRTEIMHGNVSFLQAVADFYGASEQDEEEATAEPLSPEPSEDWSKSELQQECVRRGVPFRKSWTRAQLRQALAAASPVAVTRSPAAASRASKPPKLSRAASQIVDSLEHR